MRHRGISLRVFPMEKRYQLDQLDQLDQLLRGHCFVRGPIDLPHLSKANRLVECHIQLRRLREGRQQRLHQLLLLRIFLQERPGHLHHLRRHLREQLQQLQRHSVPRLQERFRTHQKQPGLPEHRLQRRLLRDLRLSLRLRGLRRVAHPLQRQLHLQHRQLQGLRLRGLSGLL